MTTDSGHDLPNYHAKRQQQGLFRRYPVASRVGALIGGFFLLVPISMMLGLSKKADRVSTQGLGGAAVGAPSVNESVTSASAPVVMLDPATTTTTQAPTTVPVTEAPTTAATEAAAVVTAATAPAPTTTKPAPATAKPAPAAAKPTVTAAKPAPTTSKPVAKPVATTAKAASAPTAKAAPATTAKPAPKPVATTKPAPKPVATTSTPAAKPAPKPAPSTTAAPSKKWTTGEVEQLIRQMWPADSLDKALDVAWKESNYQARVYNGSCCYGVFQIHYGSHKRRLAARGLGLEGLYDPKVNIEIALEIFREQGWSPWTTA
jgi:Transglycosylase SLT domain